MRNWRANLIFILIILFGAAIIGRLFYLQIIQNDFYKALAQGQQKYFQFSKGERGEIFFSGGEVLATNIKGKYVFISPLKIEKKEETARALSEILKLEEQEVLENIKKESLFEPIKNNLTEEEVNALAELNLPGVYIDEILFRKYPQGSMASQIVGFLGGEGAGQYGVEGYYDNILQGKEGFKNEAKESIRYFFTDIEEEPIDGSDIFLTIDYNIQFMAEKLLKQAKEKLDIEGGLIMVLDPNTGKILALANFPNFDPNYYSEIQDFQIFQNGAVQKIFEPGSIFKPVTMAAALDSGKITPQTTYVDEGKVKIGSYTIYNYDLKVWGQRTMTEVLENSINTGAVFAERQMDHEIFKDYIQQFGIFEPTGIDLAGEVFSQNQEFKKGYEINFATASFGQGLEMTPIQIVRAIGCIANSGKLVRPYIVEKIVNNNKVIKTQPQTQRDSIISQKTASQLTAMLVSSVENGYAKRAKIPGYYIAGKTGTAQVSFSALGIDKPGYSEKTIQSFIGYAPALNPKFLILVKLDNPRAQSASFSTTLTAREIIKYIIDYYQIPPDYEE